MNRGFAPIDEARSALMKRVRQTRTAPEDSVAAILRELAVRYRRNTKSLPGSPDFSNVSSGWAVFVHGCFWHGHEGCERAKLPKHNRAQWSAKLSDNRARDARKCAELASRGLRVRTVWQCELDDARRVRRALERHVIGRGRP